MARCHVHDDGRKIDVASKTPGRYLPWGIEPLVVSVQMRIVSGHETNFGRQEPRCQSIPSRRRRKCHFSFRPKDFFGDFWNLLDTAATGRLKKNNAMTNAFIGTLAKANGYKHAPETPAATSTEKMAVSNQFWHRETCVARFYTCSAVVEEAAANKKYSYNARRAPWQS